MSGPPRGARGGVLQVTGTGFTPTTRPITWSRNGGGLDIADPADSVTLAQALAGSGGLAKRGAGTLALAGPNSLSGPVSVLGGELAATSPQSTGLEPQSRADYRPVDRLW